MIKSFQGLVAEALIQVPEIAPWDLQKQLQSHPDTVLLDVREPDEFAGVFLKDSLHVPRGILEQACEWGYAETVPELINAKARPVVVICRSGNRSALAALTLKSLGFENPISLKLGIKGCNDAEIALHNAAGEVVDPDWADEFLNPPISHQSG